MANGTSTAATAGGSATSGKMSVDQYNTLARQQLVSNSILKKQIIYTFTGDPATINNTINIGGNFVRMAGFLTRFIVEVNATFSVIGGSTCATTEIGAANLLSNVQFTDLQNNQRHNCPGVQLALASLMKRHYPFLTSFTSAQKVFHGPATAPPITSTTRFA